MILILNLGGSSLKFSLYGINDKLYTNGKIKFAKNQSFIEYWINKKRIIKKIEQSINNYVLYLLNFLIIQKVIINIQEIKHYVLRIVFCDYTNEPVTFLNDQLYENIKTNIIVSPIHNALSIDLIDQIKASVSNPSIICAFDSYFFHNLPLKNKKLPLNQRIANKLKLYKRGFHGISYAYGLELFIKTTKIKKPNLVMIHLGSGSSCCLIKNGKVIDNSMSYSPLSGLLMKTRTGDIDPSIVLKISEHYQWDIKQTIAYLNKEAGMNAIVNNDIAKFIDQPKYTQAQKDALEMYIKSIIKYLLSYLNQLTKVDGIIFMGGVCEFNSKVIREIVKQIKLLNLELIKDKFIVSDQLQKISSNYSQYQIYLLKSNENLMMLKYTNIMLENCKTNHSDNKNHFSNQKDN